MEAFIVLSSFAIAILTAKSFIRFFPSILPPQYGRLVTLDGLRGFLAFSVFIHHFVITYYWKVDGVWRRPESDIYQNFGKVGVVLFFMITGFLFIDRLISKKKVNWFFLFKSRLFRIQPLYLFALIMVLILSLKNTNFQIGDWQSFFKDIVLWLLFYGRSINEFADSKRIIASVDWTLKYEWLFYLSLPLIQLVFKSKILTLMIFFGGVFYLFLYPLEVLGISSKFFLYFLFGGLTAYLLKTLRNDFNYDSTSVSIATLFLILIITLYPRTLDLAHSILIFVLFFLITNGNSIFGILRWKSCRVLGEASYSIYLLHGIVLYVLFTEIELVDFKTASFIEYLTILPIVSIIVVIFSCLTFLTIEQPFIKLGKSGVKKKQNIVSRPTN